jgi:hypothetical protein
MEAIPTNAMAYNDATRGGWVVAPATLTGVDLYNTCDAFVAGDQAYLNTN